ncbi:MAG TPA: DUF3108 domain-containing protein [Burkholderiales bacterium]|nr:DUF3108 domain-containing protein [Burkholderiales bacterium]
MIDAPTWRRLGIAAALSGAAHAAIVVLGHLDLPAVPQDPLPLAVRIVSPLPVASTSLPQSEPVRHEQARARQAVLHVSTAPSPIALPRQEEPVEASVTEIEPAGDIAAESAAAEPAPPVIVATALATTYAPEPPPVRNLPRKGRITYNLVYGRDGFPVGRTVQSWEIEGDRYRLASRSETTGIVDLFRSQHRTYFSRGTLTRDGLRPQTFLMSRDRGRGTEEARAQFDWDGARIMLGAAARQRAEDLPARSQDLLSFMYQLSLNPPSPGRARQVVTNGSNIETYELDVRPEETIATPLGPLRALPIRQVGKAGAESIELWLATEYLYLPVRLRFFNREGEPQGEQIVTEIRLSEE